MTTLADLTAGQQFLFACQVTSVDATAGTGLALYGPGRSEAATAVIHPDGSMTGQLAAPANQVPVTVVTGFTPVSVGDVLENIQTGETAVARWASINPDGSLWWASSVSHRVPYAATGWTVIGHISL